LYVAGSGVPGVKKMPFSNRTIVFCFFIIPSILYAGLVTQFTFNFFAPDLLWTAYNSLASSMMDGRLDIPYESIGRESLYYDGKVYFYYGILPTAIRFLLAPFVDLSVTPVGRISVWLMTTIGVASIQYTLLFYTRAHASSAWTSIDKTKLVLLSLILWFGGAHFVIIQKATLYHEPYAAMLMVASLFISLVWRDIFWDFENRKYRLALYALLAALAVHTRQTVAFSLYLAVIILIIAAVYDSARIKSRVGRHMSAGALGMQLFRTAYPALIILGLGGGLLLFMNYVRFDDIFAMTKGEYGFHRASEEYGPRLCSKYLTGASRFELARVIPNLIYYLVGGAYTHSHWINDLGLGFVRQEFPEVLLAFLWSSILFISLYSAWILVSQLFVKITFRNILAGLLVSAFLVSVIVILSYTTVTFRYAADFFLPLGLGLLYFGNYWLNAGAASNASSNKKDIVLIIFFTLSITGNILYGAFVCSEYQKHRIPHMTNGLPSEEMLKLLKNPKPKKGTLAEACAKYDFKKR